MLTYEEQGNYFLIYSNNASQCGKCAQRKSNTQSHLKQFVKV